MNLIRKLQEHIPEKNRDEVLLHSQTKNFEPGLRFEDLDQEFLQKLSREKDIYFASSFLYNKIIYNSQSSEFIKKIDSIHIDPEKLPKIKGKLFVIPATFYKDVPEFEGDGSLIREIGSRFGLDAELLEVPPRGTISENAKFLENFLETNHDPNLHIFSISKGSADLKMAIFQKPELGKKIRAWVSIGGMFQGTRLADHFLEKNPIQKMVGKLAFKILGFPAEFISEFSIKSGILSGKNLPGTIPTRIDVIGIPVPSRIQGNLLKRYNLLSQYGPNDGFSICLDSYSPPSLIYPLWGTDHYFRSEQISSILYKIFFYLSTLE